MTPDEPLETPPSDTADTRDNGLSGPMNERLYWLTNRGWCAAILAEHPTLGAPL